MDVTEIKKLMEILDSTDVKEITLETDGTKIVLKKDKNIIRKNAVSETLAKVEVEEKVEPVNENKKSLISLNVGKFFVKDKTGKDIVKIGEAVNKDQVVGYIESIGVKQDVKSDREGIVHEILVPNGGRVEFGQPIMTILLK